MNILAIVLVIAGVIALVSGSLGQGLHFLWVVAGILLVIAIIVFLLRVISGRRV